MFQAGWDLTLIGLDGTMRTVLRGPVLEKLEAADGANARFASAILQFYLDAYERHLGERAAAMHDPLAAAVALDPSYVSCVDVPVRVELRGEHSRGATLADLRGYGVDDPTGRAEVHVAMEVDSGRFLDDLVDSLLGGGPAGT